MPPMEKMPSVLCWLFMMMGLNLVLFVDMEAALGFVLSVLSKQFFQRGIKLEVLKTNLEGVLLVKLEPFEDFRGHFVELYNEKLYKEHGIDIKFVEDDISVSRQNVLRGIHVDSEAWKLISCLYGRIYLVIVNCDTGSGNFGKWQAFTLTEDIGIQVLAPPKHGIAHLVLSERCVFWYKQSEYYDLSRQTAYRFDDPRFGIQWPNNNPILSRRDEEDDDR